VALLALCGTACGGGASPVTVQAVLEVAGSLAQLEITALPFDPDHILDSLRAEAPTAQPSFPGLEEELAAYRSPEDDRLAEATRPWLALYDTVARLADSLNLMDRRSPTYARIYQRFREQYARLQRRAAERDRALEELRGEDVALARRAQAAADSLRAWERQAYQGYAQAAGAALAASGRTVTAETTAADGGAHFALAPGRWWVVARWPDPENPFHEYYWNVAVTTTGWLPLRVPLFSRNTQRRWRH
jgi:hypothetical protein